MFYPYSYILYIRPIDNEEYTERDTAVYGDVTRSNEKRIRIGTMRFDICCGIIQIKAPLANMISEQRNGQR